MNKPITSNQIDTLVKRIVKRIEAKPKLILAVGKISKLQKKYATEKNSCQSLEDIEKAFGDMLKDLKLSKAAVQEIAKQYSQNLGLQSTTLTECFVCQTIANLFELDSFGDRDSGKDNVPTRVLDIVFSCKSVTHDETSFRYIYYSSDPQNDCVLIQTGNPNTIDAVLIKGNVGIRIEIKQIPARLEEVDIGTFDDSGKLITSQEFEQNHSIYSQYITSFNAETSVFKTEGRNVKLYDLPIGSPERIAQTALSIIGNKSINLFIFANKDRMIPVLISDFVNRVDFSESEIRPVGRNPVHYFSKQHLKKTMIDLDAKTKEIDNPLNVIVTIKKINTKPITGRGVGEKTRIGFGRFYSVRNKNLSDKGDTYEFSQESIMESKPTISLHINLKKS